MKMELQNLIYDIHDNKINFLAYCFEMTNQKDAKNTKDEIKKQLQEFEKMIEEEYAQEEYTKRETSRFKPSAIEAGYRYTQDNLPYDKSFNGEITYSLNQTFKGLEGAINISTAGNQEKTISFYKKIKEKNFKKTKNSENDMNALDFILNGGYKNQEYPGLIETNN